MDSAFSKYSAIAIKDGEIVGSGSDEDMQDQFSSPKVIDLKEKFVYPGFIDAHSHFYGYGKDLQELNLKGATSFEDMVNRTVAYAEKVNPSVIVGRGWNEEEWIVKGTVSRIKLDILFPNTPVILQRVDGHAALCNQAALDLAGIDNNFTIEGGMAVRMGDMLTGLLIDKAAELVLNKLPELSLSQQVKALKDAEKACFTAGLTCVSDAGLDAPIIKLMDSLHQTGELKIRIYAMMNPDTSEIINLITPGVLKSKKLTVRSVKLYGDGALGSRGALLKQRYCDAPDHYGLLQHPVDYYASMIDFCHRNNLQVNTHCIGDSANKILLGLYAQRLEGKNDLRWRIEHAQVVDPQDIHFFTENSIIPSIQPTHATSDATMAQERLCDGPSYNGAYIYRQLLNNTGRVAFGTDFPVEDIDPISTYFAAVKRKDKSGHTFKPEEAIDPKDALTAMTLWAAYAQFMENQLGSIEPGKIADLTILSNDLYAAPERGRTNNIMTICDGEIVYTNGVLRAVNSTK